MFGEKTIYDEINPENKNTVDILLIGIKSINEGKLNHFKFQIWEKFHFACATYENEWDFEQYLRIALPFREITSYLFNQDEETIYFSHEYMGIASCLAILLQPFPLEKTYFHAHEISTARAIIESIPCHDVAFYNFIEKDLQQQISLEDRYGNQNHLSRNALLKLTTNFNGILAVGDWVKKEYYYLIPDAPHDLVHITYNGLQTPSYSFKDKQKARKKIQNYCEKLFNYTPDIIMTHVTRLVVSKGIWRDINLMEELDDKFTKNKLKGVLIILSSLIGSGRTDEEILQMEKEYGWPILHQEGYPDLIDAEKDLYYMVHYFNAKYSSIKAVFINQFGFTTQRVGNRLSQGTTFADLRLASDAELGMSIYEPFGIAQIETIPFGGIAILSRACGSAFLLEKTFSNEEIKPYIILDFANLDPDHEHLNSIEHRTALEKKYLQKNAFKIFKTLPKNDSERKKIFAVCKKNLPKLSWNEVIMDMPFMKKSLS